MSLKYIDTTLSKDEKILKEIEIAKIVRIFAIVNIIIFVILSLTLFGLLISWIWLIAGLKIFKQERALTNDRVVAKYGIISRTTKETLLKTIETVQVNQGILERMFGYGSIIITGTGGSVMILKHVPNYQEIKNKIEECL